MMSYSLSVVIPNYNNSRFLPQCLDSILAQTYDGLTEIIVVDDCSTDDSRVLIKKYTEEYPLIKPLFLEKNGKVSAARNAGLYAAKGEYITFVDADDCYYNPDKLKNEMLVIKKYRNQGKDVVAYSSIMSMSNDGTTIAPPKKSLKYHSGDIYQTLLVDLHSSFVTRDYCVKTEMLRDIGGYNISNSLFEDYELVLKLAQKFNFFFTGETGTSYRNSINGLSKKSPNVLRTHKNQIAKRQILSEHGFYKIKLLIMWGTVQSLKNIYYFIRNK